MRLVHGEQLGAVSAQRRNHLSTHQALGREVEELQASTGDVVEGPLPLGRR
jgi:hypothetical protein